jgi:hypothetical protein
VDISGDAVKDHAFHFPDLLTILVEDAELE